MALLSRSQAIGLQVFWILISLALLGAWVTQFNRLTMTQSLVEPRLTGSIVCVALVVLAVCLDSSDPFGDSDLFDGKFLRLFAMAGVIGMAFWCLLNATDFTSVLLVLVGKKLKATPHEDEEGHETKWDKYTMVEYGVGGIWLIFAALLAVGSQDDNSVFPMVFVVMIIIGLIASIVMTSAGLYRGYSVKLGDRDNIKVDIKKNTRRLLLVKLCQIIAVHLIVIGMCMADLLLGTPWDAKIEGETQTILLIYGFGSRILVIYALLFNWIAFDADGYVENTLAERRKHYKVMCVEQKIDERIELEKLNQEQGHRVVVEDLETLNTREKDEYDAKMAVHRETGENERYLRDLESRLAKGQRMTDDEDEELGLRGVTTK